MKSASVCKAVGPASISDAQLDKINRYTRRALARDEVFIFSLVLCDNEIDRDLDRFSLASLEALGSLYLGRTGVFDHAPTAGNQSARIFDTAVEQTGGTCSEGGAYAQLKAWAYMVRCEKNADLILEIDAGIKKEVSVGCAVERVVCSICGEDQRTGACPHKKGERYDGRLCHHLLENPTDAYEWSFVAVPAQRNAGVVKRCGERHTWPDTVAVDKARLARLEHLAQLGERCEQGLREEVVRLGLLGQPGLGAGILRSMAEKLSVPELEALHKSFGDEAAKQYPLTPQLGRAVPGGQQREEYRI